MDPKAGALLGVLIGVVGAAAYAMWTFFGVVGVIVLGVFTVPIVAVVLYLGGGSGGGGGSTARASKYDSKGAKGDR